MSSTHVGFLILTGVVAMAPRWRCLAIALLAGCGTPLRQAELTIASPPVQLAATLYAPEASTPLPAVLLLHGSGPDGRENPYYQQLVDAFTRQGIAVLAYDKRGSGASTGDWRQVPFSALVDDGEAALRLLRRHPWIDSTRVGIWGGSEGATIAALVAARAPSTAFLIVQSLSGPPFGEQYRFQAAREFRGHPGDSVAAVTLVEAKLAYLRGAIAWSAYDTLARASAGRAFAAYAAPSAPDSWWWRWYATKTDVSALPALAALRIPVLAVWGAEDLLVPADSSSAMVRAARAPLGVGGDEIRVISGASHTMHVPGLRGLFAGAGLRNRPVHLGTMAAWAAARTCAICPRGVALPHGERRKQFWRSMTVVSGSRTTAGIVGASEWDWWGIVGASVSDDDRLRREGR